MPILQYSAEEKERFVDLSSLLQVCHGVLRDVMEETQAEAAPGSAPRMTSQT